MQVGKNLLKWRFPLVVYFVWRILIWWILLLNPTLTFFQKYYWSWVRFWDSGHYIAIAQNGYHFPQQAFFPLWPLLIRVMSLTGLSAFISSFILSNILSLLVFINLYALTKRLTTADIAKRSLIIFASFPTSFFLLTSYSEALFLCLTLSSFLLNEKKQSLMGSFLAGLSSATRLVGLALIPFYFFSKKPLFQRFGLVIISGLGFLIYTFYLYKNFGDPFYFIQAEKDWCLSAGRCGIFFPLNPLRNFVELILSGKIIVGLSPTFLDGTLTVIFLVLSIKVLLNFGKSYFIYCLIIILLPLSSGSLVGMSRYAIAAIPIFWTLPLILKNKLVLFILCLLLFFIQIHLINLFINQDWVA